FVETNPRHKLSQLRAFGGLSGSEYEITATPRFFERYLATPEFNDTRDFLLAYELQKRFFIRDDVVQIEDVRAMALRIQNADPKFKPLRDAVHNQISAGLIPPLEQYAESLPKGALRTQVDQLIAELGKLTSPAEHALAGQVHGLADPELSKQFRALLPAENADPVDARVPFGQPGVRPPHRVAPRSVPPADARRLIALDITAAGSMQARGSALLGSGTALTAEQYLRLLGALTDATYGAGLL